MLSTVLLPDDLLATVERVAEHTKSKHVLPVITTMIRIRLTTVNSTDLCTSNALRTFNCVLLTHADRLRVDAMISLQI